MKAPGQRLGLGMFERYGHFPGMGERGGDLMRGAVIGEPVEYLFARSMHWWAGYGETRM